MAADAFNLTAAYQDGIDIGDQLLAIDGIQLKGMIAI